ncbi:efflux RND transporter periplasmic adaptor subunit, partial [Mycobacterium tuberculosis]|nr:efflux RND transporter periplasmic adaptor subunit [Mycobacterium tuberculosis]
MASGAEGLFRIITDGAIDLNADVAAEDMARLAIGMPATIAAPGLDETIAGKVRLISEEVDPATRTGKVRIALPTDKGLRIGSFASGTVLVTERTGVAVPASAVQAGAEGPSVQGGRDGRTKLRRFSGGSAGGRVYEVVR